MATQQMVQAAMDETARRELGAALERLHNKGNLVVRVADVLGGTLGRAGEAVLRRMGLPASHPMLTAIAEAALTRAYDVAILGIEVPSAPLNAPLAAASGIAGGFAGALGFLPDASFTTLLIMRAIAQVARAQGEDLTSEAGRAACVEVFSLRANDESGYFAARLMLQSNSARALLANVASRWGTVLGEKFAAQAMPLAGALAGAALNTAFLAHYRGLAQAHFTIRRLQRVFGPAAIATAAPALRPVEDARFFED